MQKFFTTSYDKLEIVTLRKSAFKNSFKENVNLEGLNWNETDENSIHFSLRSENLLLSTLRITCFKESRRLENSTRISIHKIRTPPFVLLSRAATDCNFKFQNLHSELRLRAVEFCKFYGLENIYGSLERKSNRLKPLLNLGYEIIEEQEAWPKSFLANNGNVVLIELSGDEKLSNFIKSEKLRLQIAKDIDFQNINPIYF